VLVSAKKGGDNGAAQPKSVSFNLGGTTGATPPASPTPKTPIAGNTPPAAPPTFNPPPAAPPARRSFSRSAAGFTVAPDLILTTSAAVKGAKRVMIEIPNAQPIEVTVVRTDDSGLALLRVEGKKFAYLNLAAAFPGGPVQCPAFPEVSVFGVSLETLRGTATSPKGDAWKVALAKHPRLPGAPLLDGSGNCVGIELADREDLTDRLPALAFDKIKSFLAADAPAQPCGNPGSALVVQITASFER
jgi:hypothetical protein